jgi:4-amino-4-deoxy-L-arabinose transferase-like glycosyltransferase
VRLAVNILLAGIVFVIALAINFHHVEQTELHPDETRWLNRAHYLDDFLDPFGPTWQDYYLTRGQPPGGSYLMGLGLLVQGQPRDTVGVWDFNYGLTWVRGEEPGWNELAGATPSEDVLLAGRRTNAVVGALVVVLVFVVASQLTNAIGGLAAGLILANHPLQITLSTQALSDQLLALSLGVTFAAAYQFARKPNYGWALVMGVAIGVGGATKLAPLALSFALAGYGGLWLAWTWWRHRRTRVSWANRKFGLLLLAQPVIAGITFVVMYPYLWVSPIVNSLHLLDFRRTEMASQARILPHARVDDPVGAFLRYGQQLHGAYSSTRDGIAELGNLINRDFSGATSLDLMMGAVGMILVIRMVIEFGLWSPQALVIMLMAAEVGAVTVGLGVDFYRYYLPILVVISILVGVTFGELARVLWHFVQRPAPVVTPSTTTAPLPLHS